MPAPSSLPKRATATASRADHAQRQRLETLRGLRAPLLRWYRRVRRDLPWRATDDPYAVWVSEIMLQQTQVATVLPYFERFVARFPNIASLAAAEEDEVLALWSGLGYYRRGMALHRAARQVQAEHGGRLPDDPKALRGLPGIGDYTAGAIASIAFGQAEPILDGNVRRVFSRIFALEPGPEGPAADTRLLWEFARGIVEGPDPGDLNQALMELGAIRCTPRKPDCSDCPARQRCEGRKRGDPERFPILPPRVRPTPCRVAVAWIQDQGRVLLEAPGSDNPLRGRWDLPAVELADQALAAEALQAALRDRHGVDWLEPRYAGQAKHGVMRRRFELLVHAAGGQRTSAEATGRSRWQPVDQLGSLPISGATRKIQALVAKAPHRLF